MFLHFLGLAFLDLADLVGQHLHVLQAVVDLLAELVVEVFVDGRLFVAGAGLEGAVEGEGRVLGYLLAGEKRLLRLGWRWGRRLLEDVGDCYPAESRLVLKDSFAHVFVDSLGTAASFRWREGTL